MIVIPGWFVIYAGFTEYPAGMAREKLTTPVEVSAFSK
jgi:hypothetical protein